MRDIGLRSFWHAVRRRRLVKVTGVAYSRVRSTKNCCCSSEDARVVDQHDRRDRCLTLWFTPRASVSLAFFAFKFVFLASNKLLRMGTLEFHCRVRISICLLIYSRFLYNSLCLPCSYLLVYDSRLLVLCCLYASPSLSSYLFLPFPEPTM